MELNHFATLSLRGADPDRAAYEDALMRLCEVAEIQPADRDTVRSREAIVLAGSVIAFQFEQWSNFIKVFIEVGKPEESDKLAFYRWVLTQHLAMPAPFSMVAALHPETDQIVLYGALPLPDSPEADQSFLAFLHGCVQVCETLRHPDGIARL